MIFRQIISYVFLVFCFVGFFFNHWPTSVAAAEQTFSLSCCYKWQSQQGWSETLSLKKIVHKHLHFFVNKTKMVAAVVLNRTIASMGLNMIIFVHILFFAVSSNVLSNWPVGMAKRLKTTTVCSAKPREWPAYLPLFTLRSSTARSTARCGCQSTARWWW